MFAGNFGFYGHQTQRHKVDGYYLNSSYQLDTLWFNQNYNEVIRMNFLCCDYTNPEEKQIYLCFPLVFSLFIVTSSKAIISHTKKNSH